MTPMAGESPTGRRGHHRGRRGDRRGGRGRGPGQGQGQGPGQGPGPQAQGPGAQGAREAQPPRPNRLDVEQIIRELRARIATERGVELSTTQVAELAARRLETVLAPGQADQALLARLRESATSGATAVPAPAPLPAYTFDASSLYGSGGGLVGLLRRVFRPLLRLLFDPDPLVEALSTQARVNAELAARAQQVATRQAEWNALLYELVTRAVTENARASMDVETLAAQVEALGARTEFNERRVRDIEGAAHQARTPRSVPMDSSGPAPEGGAAVVDGDGDGRRRRRRRRGRRGGESDGPAPFGGSTQGQAPRDGAAPREWPAVSGERSSSPAPIAPASNQPVVVEHSHVAPAVSSTPPPEPVHAPVPLPVTPSPGPQPAAAPPSASTVEAEPSKWRQVFSPPPAGRGNDSES
jgi:hypothetical protein